MAKKLNVGLINQIKALRKQGFTGYQIAETLNIGKTCAYKYIREKSYPRWSDEEKHVVINGLARGSSIKDIVRKLDGRSMSSVKHIIHKHRKGIRKDPKKRLALSLIGKGLDAGLTPGETLRKIRKYDAFGRAKKELMNNDL